jgi:putative tryptophan/tyrosine transport system substrate-binding protein
MIRREFIAGLGGAVVWPRAQQTTIPMVGYLFVGSRDDSITPAFVKGLSEMGFIEGQNVAIEYRWAENQFDRLPALAAELVRKRVAVIYAAGGPTAVSAAKAVTTTIPTVFAIRSDPLQTGLVASFNRPGGNVTGVSFMNPVLVGKRLGLLQELVPAVTRFALLVYLSENAVQIATLAVRHGLEWGDEA